MSGWMNECWPIVFRENLGYVGHVFYFLNFSWSMIVVLVSAVQWNELTVCIHISSLSLTSLLPTLTSQPSASSQRAIYNYLFLIISQRFYLMIQTSLFFFICLWEKHSFLGELTNFWATSRWLAIALGTQCPKVNALRLCKGHLCVFLLVTSETWGPS